MKCIKNLLIHIVIIVNFTALVHCFYKSLHQFILQVMLQLEANSFVVVFPFLENVFVLSLLVQEYLFIEAIFASATWS